MIPAGISHLRLCRQRGIISVPVWIQGSALVAIQAIKHLPRYEFIVESSWCKGAGYIRAANTSLTYRHEKTATGHCSSVDILTLPLLVVWAPLYHPPSAIRNPKSVIVPRRTSAFWCTG